MPGNASFLLIVLLKNFRLRRWMFSPDTLPDENVRVVWLCAMVFWDWCSYVGAYCCSRSRGICGAFPFAFLFVSSGFNLGANIPDTYRENEWYMVSLVCRRARVCFRFLGNSARYLKRKRILCIYEYLFFSE